MLNLTKAFVGNTELMECYIGENNDTVALQLVTDMGAGAGETNCFECSGAAPHAVSRVKTH